MDSVKVGIQPGTGTIVLQLTRTSMLEALPPRFLARCTLTVISGITRQRQRKRGEPNLALDRLFCKRYYPLALPEPGTILAGLPSPKPGRTKIISGSYKGGATTQRPVLGGTLVPTTPTYIKILLNTGIKEESESANPFDFLKPTRAA